MEILKEEQNPLFDRKEVYGKLLSKASPVKGEIAKMLSDKYSVPADAIRVLTIKGKFGTNEFWIKAHVYKSLEEKNKTERLTKKEIESESKSAIKEEPKQVPAPAPEVTA
ncbi:MAG TPA: hypothetical protein VJ438_03700 [Candidatus Nanoarchaeia archaeon]|nr:hypothetical protein [Candidatus Nanoarchaeia archaeon]